MDSTRLNSGSPVTTVAGISKAIPTANASAKEMGKLALMGAADKTRSIATSPICMGNINAILRVSRALAQPCLRLDIFCKKTRR
jgi:hypothetical protein